jgi:hypothetical protein
MNIIQPYQCVVWRVVVVVSRCLICNFFGLPDIIANAVWTSRGRLSDMNAMRIISGLFSTVKNRRCNKNLLVLALFLLQYSYSNSANARDTRMDYY